MCLLSWSLLEGFRCLLMNVVKFSGKHMYYEQTVAVFMSSPVGRVLATLFMCDCF